MKQNSEILIKTIENAVQEKRVTLQGMGRLFTLMDQ
jgi:hypothetical protein